MLGILPRGASFEEQPLVLYKMSTVELRSRTPPEYEVNLEGTRRGKVNQPWWLVNPLTR